MLVGLSVRDIVLIDQLSLTFSEGLSALTGETGAGKSILLDALGLALGARGDSGLVRHGASQAQVVAEFDLPPHHPVEHLLHENDLSAERAPGEPLIVRRVLGADGRSRAFANDQPVSVALLRRIGACLVEVHGQFDTQGLFDAQTHRAVLDAYGRLERQRDQVAEAWRTWRRLEHARTACETEIAEARRDEAFLRHALAELETLDPQPDEEAALADRRTLLMHREKLVEAINAGLAEVSDEGGVERGIGRAARQLERVRDKAPGRLDGALAALDRAAAEIAEARGELQHAAADMDLDVGELDALEERLFALRAAARKHGVAVDALAELRDRFAARLAALADQGDALAELVAETNRARADFLQAGERLSTARREAAGALDAAVAAELPPLKLEKARFATQAAALPEADWGPDGIDRVQFTVATNPGAPPGPLTRIASGGELARFMLALKVVLADSRRVETGAAPTLVFDEVDAGISGAVAAAVGERLARLSAATQVLVVTHSPQVAARAAHHWRVEKRELDVAGAERVVTDVVALDDLHRREEIARMLSGARITDQARAAAASLMAAR